jgi:hypothetical protein
MLEHLGIANNFPNKTSITQQIRARADKWDYIKLKRFCTAKETVSRLKRHHTEWEKIFASLYI